MSHRILFQLRNDQPSIVLPSRMTSVDSVGPLSPLDSPADMVGNRGEVCVYEPSYTRGLMQATHAFAICSSLVDPERCVCQSPSEKREKKCPDANDCVAEIDFSCRMDHMGRSKHDDQADPER